MLNTQPPGYDPSTVNRQNNQLLGRPGAQNTALAGMKTAMTPGTPGLSSNPLVQQQNNQIVMRLLQGMQS